MKLIVKTEAGELNVVAKAYAFPKKGNADADYAFTVGGEKCEVAMTGGGKYPRYAYFKVGGKSYYLPKDVVPVSGSDVVKVVEEAKPAEEKLASIEDRGPEGIADLQPQEEKPVAEKPKARRRAPKGEAATA